MLGIGPLDPSVYVSFFLAKHAILFHPSNWENDAIPFGHELRPAGLAFLVIAQQPRSYYRSTAQVPWTLRSSVLEAGPAKTGRRIFGRKLSKVPFGIKWLDVSKFEFFTGDLHRLGKEFGFLQRYNSQEFMIIELPHLFLDFATSF